MERLDDIGIPDTERCRLDYRVDRSSVEEMGKPLVEGDGCPRRFGTGVGYSCYVDRLIYKALTIRAKPHGNRRVTHDRFVAGDPDRRLAI